MTFRRSEPRASVERTDRRVCTELTNIDAAKWPSLAALAPAGSLSPSSTTSLLWRRTWPFKPRRGGGGRQWKPGNAGQQVVVGPESLRLLTTSHDMTTTPIAESRRYECRSRGGGAALRTHQRSVSGVLAGDDPRAGRAWRAPYSEHARHASHRPAEAGKEKYLLRRFGYGAVSLSETHSIPAIAEDHPGASGNDYSVQTRRWRLSKLGGVRTVHALPWPAAELERIADKTVALRCLFYFVSRTRAGVAGRAGSATNPMD